MFITTANTTSTIPRPLLDRMEVIEISSYTEEEKVMIAERYLVPKMIAENGLKKSQLNITESAIRDMIEYYTREAGVRNLERMIGNACRKTAKNIVSGKSKKNTITAKTLDNFIGKKIYIEALTFDFLFGLVKNPTRNRMIERVKKYRMMEFTRFRDGAYSLIMLHTKYPIVIIAMMNEKMAGMMASFPSLLIFIV